MSRLAPFDKALVWILVPLWIVCFALSVRTQLRGGGVAIVAVSIEDSESYPTLSGERRGYPNQFAAAGLKTGDRLIQLGDADLRGVGALGIYALRMGQGTGDVSVPLVFERDGETHETSLSLPSVAFSRPLLLVSFAFAASALWLILRGRPTPTLRAYFHAGMCMAITGVASPMGIGTANAGYVVLHGVWVAAMALLFPLLIRFAFLIPD